MSTTENGNQTVGDKKRAIANLVVGLYREYMGRGPTGARATIHDDLVTCVLHDTLTRVERTLVTRGEAHSVLQRRRVSQRLMRYVRTARRSQPLPRPSTGNEQSRWLG